MLTWAVITHLVVNYLFIVQWSFICSFGSNRGFFSEKKLFQHFTNIYRITSVLKVETDIITPITVSLTEGWDRHYHSYHSESDWRLRQTLSLLSQWVWLKVETNIITPITVSLTEGWDKHYHSYHSESDWRLRQTLSLLSQWVWLDKLWYLL
jgi:hypothetical protein